MQFKRGDTFSLSGTLDIKDADDAVVPDITGWTIRSHLRGYDGESPGELIAELDAVILDGPNRLIKISKDESVTVDWPIGLAIGDIQITSPDADPITVSTEPFKIQITEGVTR